MRPNRLDRKNVNTSPDCAKVQACALAYLDTELDAVQRAWVQTHLDACAECREEVAQYRRAESVLTSAALAIPPIGDLRAGFYRKLAASRAPHSNRRWARGGLLAVPVCAAGLLWFLWRPIPAPPVSDSVHRQTPSVVVADLPPSVLGRVPHTTRKPPKMLHRILGPAKMPAPYMLSEALPTRLPGKPVQIASSAPPMGTMRALSSSVTSLGAGVRLERVDDVALKTGRYGRLGLSEASIERERTVSDMPRTFADSETNYRGAESFAYAPPTSDARSEKHPVALGYENELAKKEMEVDAFLEHNTLKEAALSKTALAQKKQETTSFGMEQKASALSLDRKDVEESQLRWTLKKEASESDGVDLQVRDEVRGFESRTRVAGTVEQHESGEVLTIEAESEDGS